MLSIITLAAASPLALNKRSSSKLIAFVDNNSIGVDASGAVPVNLGFEQAVLNFNCHSNNWDASCQMVKCGLSGVGTLTNCEPAIDCGHGSSSWDSSVNREKVNVFYEATASSIRCAMFPF